MLTDLPVESIDKGTDLIGSRCRKTSNIMGQTCDMISITLSKIGHSWNAAGGILIGDVPLRWNSGFDPIENLYFFSIRNNYFLSHMSDDLIDQKNNGRPKLFGEVKGIDGHVITFPNG